MVPSSGIWYGHVPFLAPESGIWCGSRTFSRSRIWYLVWIPYLFQIQNLGIWYGSRTFSRSCVWYLVWIPYLSFPSLESGIWCGSCTFYSASFQYLVWITYLFQLQSLVSGVCLSGSLWSCRHSRHLSCKKMKEYMIKTNKIKGTCDEMDFSIFFLYKSAPHYRYLTHIRKNFDFCFKLVEIFVVGNLLLRNDCGQSTK